MKKFLTTLFLIASISLFSQNYKKGDVVYKVSFGTTINYNSTMEVVLREKSNRILIRNTKVVDDPATYAILEKKTLEPKVWRFHLTSEYDFKGYLLINESKNEMFLVEDGQQPGYVAILAKTTY
jgi:hypothetical protein